ncbi:MAG: c-type cytochrome [Vulcanimicrobiaceae bacterium]
MRIQTVGFVAMITLGVLTFTGCSKPASTAQSTAAPSATAKAAAEKAASPVPGTPTAAPIGTSRPSVRNVAPAATRRAEETIVPAKTAKPLSPKTVVTPVRKTSAPAATAAARPSATPTSGAPSVVAETGDAVHGKQLYMQNCSTCHGTAGQGDIGPSLQNEASRKNLDQTIAWIKNPTPPMPKLYPGSLSDKDVLDVATYVESLK